MHTPGQHKQLPAHSDGRPYAAPERMVRPAPANTSRCLCRVRRTAESQRLCRVRRTTDSRRPPDIESKKRENKYRCKPRPFPPRGGASLANRFCRRLLAHPVCDTSSTPIPRGGQAGPAAAAANRPAASCWALSAMCLTPAHSGARALKNQPQVREDRHGSRRIPPVAARAKHR